MSHPRYVVGHHRGRSVRRIDISARYASENGGPMCRKRPQRALHAIAVSSLLSSLSPAWRAANQPFKLDGAAGRPCPLPRDWVPLAAERLTPSAPLTIENG